MCTLALPRLSRSSGSPPPYSVRVIGGQRDTRELGGVSNVAREGNNTLQIKSRGVAITTFDTLPEPALCYRYCSPLDRGLLDIIEQVVQRHCGAEVGLAMFLGDSSDVTTRVPSRPYISIRYPLPAQGLLATCTEATPPVADVLVATNFFTADQQIIDDAGVECVGLLSGHQIEGVCRALSTIGQGGMSVAAHPVWGSLAAPCAHAVCGAFSS